MYWYTLLRLGNTVVQWTGLKCFAGLNLLYTLRLGNTELYSGRFGGLHSGALQG